MDLKKWNEEVFCNVGKQKNDLLDDICDLDSIAKERPFDALKGKERMKFLGI